MIQPGAVFQPEETLRRAFAADERAVALIDVAGDELRAFCIRAGDEDRRYAADVRCQARRIEVANRRLGRDQPLAAEMAALLLRRELVLEVTASPPRLDIGLHDLEAVQGAAKAGLRVGE